jgi:choline-glycine betaine transporter
MKTLFTSALAGKFADAASDIVGTNPFVRLGAAGLATRIAAASLPLALVAFGAVTAWSRYHKSDKAKTRTSNRRKARASKSAKKASTRATPQAAAA